ncbi:MAG: CapA family protein [Hyphomicrobiaceae bacterium]
MSEVQTPNPHLLTLPRSETDRDEVFVIVLVGDTGLNASRQRVRPNAAVRHGKRYGWPWTTKHVAPLIDGHLNFANIETVVTARNSLSPRNKLYNFRMHPNGLRHLVDTGFNLLSLANNHSADYGRRGILDTLKHADRLRSAGLRAHAGLGRDRAGAVAAKAFRIDGGRFAFAAMGIGAGAPGVARAGARKPGQVSIHDKRVFFDVVDGLAQSQADFRILSMHYGQEREVYPAEHQVRRWRDEVLVGRDIDLIVGHHTHVAQGVQMTNGKLIFYGLGNFLHLGTQDMSKFNACRDYGLLARVFVVRDATGAMTAQAVQVVPLTDMHLQPRPMTGKRARRRIDVLNFLVSKLDDEIAGSRGVRFAKQVDGSGLFCRPGAENMPGRAGTLCEGFVAPDELAPSTRSRLSRLCRSRRVAVGVKKRRFRKRARRKVRRKLSSF